MCQVSNRVYTRKTPLVFYKQVTVVANGSMRSLYSPVDGRRRRDLGFPTLGEVLTYIPGKVVRSPSGPGIMGFATESAARDTYAVSIPTCIIKLVAPAGAKLRYGMYHSGERVIAASRVRVVKE